MKAALKTMSAKILYFAGFPLVLRSLKMQGSAFHCIPSPIRRHSAGMQAAHSTQQLQILLKMASTARMD